MSTLLLFKVRTKARFMPENYVQTHPIRHLTELHSFGDETNEWTGRLTDLVIMNSLYALCSEEPIKTSIIRQHVGESLSSIVV
jgi:hypothetical protein